MLKFYPYRIFEEGNKKYIFINNSNGLFEIDDKTLAIINQEGKMEEEAFDNVSDVLSQDEFNNLISDMKKYLFIKNDENDKLILQKNEREIPSNFSSLTLLLAQGCNLRCKYCYGDGGSYHDEGFMSFDTAKKAIDYLIEQAIQKELHIAFFGGEPLLNFKVIRQITEYVRKIEEKGEHTFILTMTSNGILLDEEKLKFIIENNIGIQISFDGNEEVQNANRYYANGRGSYNDVVHRTAKLRKIRPTSCRATVTHEGLDVLNSFYHLVNLGFKSVMFAPADNLLSDQDYSTMTQEYLKLIKEFERLVRNGEYELAKKCKYIISGLKRIQSGGIKTLVCGVGRNMYAVDIHGNMYPCQRFVGIKEFIMGNVDDGIQTRDSFLKQIHIKAHNQCQQCWAQNLCLGHCPNENYYATGCVNKTSTRICSFTKIINEELIHIYLRMSSEELKRLIG